MTAQFVVGIDLGTTHTVVAYAAVDARRTRTAPEPLVFDIPQLVANGETEARPLLRSCLYAPLPGEVEGAPDFVVGELARKRGGELPSRFIASAKSWLSHGAVDRTAAILPWGADGEGTKKLSPVEASARVLAHVRAAWDEAHPDAPLAAQDVVLTLPASFDDVARTLTLRAAEMAGLAPSLVEEPTAAFYDAMRDVESMREHAGAGGAGPPGDAEKTVLVVDVGGGTTDLSLMAIAMAPKAAGGFTVRRVAVGRHILLGGDNMDLALAHLVEPQIAGTAPGARLDPLELAQLVLACRDAKERLLAGRVKEARVTVLGRGTKLVGGARSGMLTKEDVERVVVGGFFPVDVEPKAAGARSGIVAFGLPYERDPAITRHVRQFLTRHAAELPRGVPDTVLLNGGVFHGKPIVRALSAAMKLWGGKAPTMLPNEDPDLAVARGAVRYGFARRGLGVRVESGAARGYYVALAPEGSHEMRAVCILPRGAREGVKFQAEGRTFELVVGRSVRFDLYESDVAKDEVGAIVKLEGDTFERLPPVVTQLPGVAKEAAVKVVLGGELLTTGQLELACVEAGGASRRFRLEFQLREGARAVAPPPPTSLAPPSMSPSSAGGAAPNATKLAEGERILDKVFGKKGEASPRETKDVVRDVEQVLGDRQRWTMETCRHVADRLLQNPGARRRTPAHERAFWMLLGFCLRPGFGDPGDPSRLERVWPLFEGRLGFPGEAHGWQQFFIAWRRVAGGLLEPQQLLLRDALDAVVAPPEAGLKPPKRMPEHVDELTVMLASLERVPAPRRVQLGEWLVEKTWTKEDARIWWSLGRIGARVPLYASVHHVVPPKHAEAWLERLLRADWKTVGTASHVAVQLARVTGDRARDVSERLRGEVQKKLLAAGAKDEWVRAVRELVDVGEEDRAAMFGEGLPIGLRLVDGG